MRQGSAGGKSRSRFVALLEVRLGNSSSVVSTHPRTPSVPEVVSAEGDRKDEKEETGPATSTCRRRCGPDGPSEGPHHRPGVPEPSRTPTRPHPRQHQEGATVTGLQGAKTPPPESGGPVYPGHHPQGRYSPSRLPTLRDTGVDLGCGFPTVGVVKWDVTPFSGGPPSCRCGQGCSLLPFRPMSRR